MDALYFYVWRKNNGYKPRRKHATIELAMAEAERLIGKYPESTFLVLAAVAEVRAEQS